ncbi:MAG: hypothetical protein NVS3B18_09290 [Candidatus Dormibacteria bacterium]
MASHAANAANSYGVGGVAQRTDVRYAAAVIDRQAATVSALRTRLAALGGTGVGPRPLRAPERSACERAADLGFAIEPATNGEVFVRRLAVDLEPFRQAAGLDSPPTVAELLALLDHPSAEGGPAWVSGEGVGVLDIESLGLRGSGVLAFLVGLGVQRGDTLYAEQYLLVDPGNEAAMLGVIAAVIRSQRLWVTYNGRSFDVPGLAARCTINRLDPASVEPRLHGDVLGPVRRLFRDRLGACTLRRAEMALLNHHRVDDIPGSEAPARYRAWLRGAPAPVLGGVVEHNLQDIVSTVVLAARLAAHVSGRRVSPAHPADAYQLARHLERRGEGHVAEAELRAAIDAAVEPWARRAGHRLAVLLQQRGEMGAALHLWHRLHESDPRDLRAARGYAIRLEHSGCHDAALEVCLRVRRLRVEVRPWWPRLAGGGRAADLEWERRELRLRRRVHS